MDLKMMIFNSAINMYQSIIITYFLTKCLERKTQFDKWTVNCVFVISLFIYLELQSFFTEYEGMGIIATLLLTYILSIAFCKCALVEKLLYNVIIIILLVFSAILSGRFIGMFHGIGYVELVSTDSTGKIIGVILTQVILFLFVKLIVKHRQKQEKIYDPKFTLLTLAIPCISIILIVVFLNMSYTAIQNAMNESIVIGGIIFINIIVFIMLNYERGQYDEKLKKSLTLSAYEQQQEDIEEINRRYAETQKRRHEIKRVLLMVRRFIADSKINEALSYLDSFDVNKIIKLEQIVYTNNAVLNYLLNRNIEECKRNSIDVKCMVNGSIDGIENIDIHILVGNLIDNAMEAAIKSADPYIDISILGNDNCVCIEIRNTAIINALKDNPNMNTTKDETYRHGYGIQNIKTIVDKYDGTIEYSSAKVNVVTCKVILIKGR